MVLFCKHNVLEASDTDGGQPDIYDSSLPDFLTGRKPTKVARYQGVNEEFGTESLRTMHSSELIGR